MKTFDEPAPDQTDDEGADQHERPGHGNLPEEELYVNNLGILNDEYQGKEQKNQDENVFNMHAAHLKNTNSCFSVNIESL